jgi:hypothetical protein
MFYINLIFCALQHSGGNTRGYIPHTLNFLFGKPETVPSEMKDSLLRM